MSQEQLDAVAVLVCIYVLSLLLHAQEVQGAVLCSGMQVCHLSAGRLGLALYKPGVLTTLVREGLPCHERDRLPVNDHVHLRCCLFLLLCLHGQMLSAYLMTSAASCVFGLALCMAGVLTTLVREGLLS